MNLKSKLIEFMVVHGLIPTRIRWKRSTSGIGRMFSNIFHILDQDERVKLIKMMYSWGFEDVEEVIKTLNIKRDLHGCAIALMGVHRIRNKKPYCKGKQ